VRLSGPRTDRTLLAYGHAGFDLAEVDVDAAFGVRGECDSRDDGLAKGLVAKSQDVSSRWDLELAHRRHQCA
jgi:hypothetical protein